MQFQTVIRAQVAQAAINKFYSKPFQWGKRDCAHLVAFTLEQMGHENPLKEIKHYNTPLGARKAMKAAGIKDLAEHLDGLGFERIGYASCLPADLIAIQGYWPGGEEAVALGISIDHNRVLAFADVDGKGPKGAWAPADKVVLHAWRVPVLAQHVPVQVEPSSVLPPDFDPEAADAEEPVTEPTIEPEAEPRAPRGERARLHAAMRAAGFDPNSGGAA